MTNWLAAVFMVFGVGVSGVATATFIDATSLGNITVSDPDGDLVFTSVSSTSSLRVRWRNVNFLNQRDAFRSVLEFDLSAVTPGATIDSAILTITPTQVGSSAGGADFDFFGYVGDGVLGLADADAGTVLVENVLVPNTNPFQVDFTAFLQGVIDGGDSIVGINIRSADEGVTNNTFDEEFRSNGSGTSSTVFPGPQLTISFTPNAVPLPGSLWLTGLGLLALVRFRPGI